jgi:hypothetical protein
MVVNPYGVARGVLYAQFDGREVAERPPQVPLLDDGKIHHVQVTLG